jgi:hypothetical integral membrane protein (TIGR02206 family)
LAAPFVPFGPPHLAVLALTVAVPLLAAAVTRAARNRTLERSVAWAFAILLIATDVLWYSLLYAEGWMAPRNVLPMHLCDWAAITTVITLFYPNQRTYELSYFWGLGGTLQAILTPELAYDFPDLRFVVFFGFHGGIIAGVLYLTVGMGWRPILQSIPRVFAWSMVYVASASLVDYVFGTNFGYLRSKPVTPSLLDLLSPWPYYVLEMIALGLLLSLVLYAPFFGIDQLRRRSAA